MTLPEWARRYIRCTGRIFPTPESRMGLAVDLARRNVAEGTGGPFGAAVFERESGRLVGVGVNGVERLAISIAHAEIVALCLAQHRVGAYDLGRRGQPAHELVSSAQPCAMCLGALLWSGVTRLVYAAARQDVETIVGFDEGPVQRRWQHELALRGIDVSSGLLRAEAREVLRLYKDMGGSVYNGRGAERPTRNRGPRRRGRTA
jgi:tRNA(Arg) A34 adenosine deaminase TadA